MQRERLADESLCVVLIFCAIMVAQTAAARTHLAWALPCDVCGLIIGVVWFAGAFVCSCRAVPNGIPTICEWMADKGLDRWKQNDHFSIGLNTASLLIIGLAMLFVRSYWPTLAVAGIVSFIAMPLSNANSEAPKRA